MNEDQNINDDLQPENDSGEQPTVNSSSSTEQKQESEISNPKPEIKNMEVHHHPHVEKKSFKEYLLEGLMIFLAVVMGFFAENIREHFVEQKQEKEYIKSMLEDIIKDTAMLSATAQKTLKVFNNIDTITHILQNEKFVDSSILILYRTNLRSLSNFAPQFTDRTTTELKNSGSMRLIRKKNVVDGIVNYWNQINILQSINETIDEYKFKTRELSYTIFNQKYYSSKNKLVYVNTATPKLMTNDLRTLTEFANRLNHIEGLILTTYIPNINLQQENTKKLLKLIETEYHLNNE